MVQASRLPGAKTRAPAKTRNSVVAGLPTDPPARHEKCRAPAKTRKSTIKKARIFAKTRKSASAVVADAPAKQSLHLRDFNTGQRNGSAFRLVSFVGARGFASPEKVPVFYGQSVSLVKYLVERGSPADFVRFLHRADEVGCDTALAEVDGLRDIGELDHQWRTAAMATRKATFRDQFGRVVGGP